MDNRSILSTTTQLPINVTRSPRMAKKASASKLSGRANSLKYPKSKPRPIDLPALEAYDNTYLSSSTPVFSSGWSKSNYNDALLTPIDSPEGPFGAYWEAAEGSVISSSSSSDSISRTTIPRRKTKLERPFVGRPTDNKERCMSVSLVMDSNGLAQVQREEVEVEFLENQKELGHGTTSLLKRMVSSAGSDASISRNLNNMSLVNSTRGEVLVRSASQQTDISHSIPLTPLAGQTHHFVSPMHLRKDSEVMSRSVSALRTPEFSPWDDSDEDVEHAIDNSVELDDAQHAVQRAFERKHRHIASGFIGSSIPLSPMAPARVASSSTTCSACQIVCRSRSALAAHTARCSVKQTPFVSTDFFESFDVFQMSEDALFMSNFTNQVVDEISSNTKHHGGLLEPAFLDCFEVQDDISLCMSPRKKSRLSRPPLPVTPSRSQSSSAIPTSKRQR